MKQVQRSPLCSALTILSEAIAGGAVEKEPEIIYSPQEKLGMGPYN
ncbi:predicted protein [Plenodomus lingam JN3]|uniref:Predicted protein n=1 Tax=Leptosphaeria maculans (strain JN3 / isolate v23.1.3 / race Av1-4-5-6-7-8) TaxID=985895 RepID=E4ZNN3_LEPMJ|nr:predicted protein [Plenodomus lingam JN3]CBX93252.1 predicted protein [Plenodomus lingam JN3]